jgi:multiple sugar transport system ATP-binding protein
LILGIRPEHIKVNDEGREGSIKATIQVTEPLGSEVILNLTVGEIPLKAIASEHFPAKPGESKYALLDVDKIHIFDKKNEKAII